MQFPQWVHSSAHRWILTGDSLHIFRCYDPLSEVSPFATLCWELQLLCSLQTVSFISSAHGVSNLHLISSFCTVVWRPSQESHRAHLLVSHLSGIIVFCYLMSVPCKSWFHMFSVFCCFGWKDGTCSCFSIWVWAEVCNFFIMGKYRDKFGSINCF